MVSGNLGRRFLAAIEKAIWHGLVRRVHKKVIAEEFVLRAHQFVSLLLDVLQMVAFYTLHSKILRKRLVGVVH